MRLLLLAAFVSAAAVLVWPVAGLAQDPAPHDHQLAELSAQVPGHDGVSFFALLKQVIPDLTNEDNGATGHSTVALRHIAGEASGGELPDPIRLGVLRALPFRSEGKPRIAMLIGIREGEDMGEQPALLAVFDESSRIPALVDVVDVGMDRLTSFADPAVLRIGEHEDAILTTSQHFNADESYDATALIFLRGGKLGLVDRFSAYGSRTCALNTTQTFSFRAAPEAGRSPYYAITVTMRDAGVRAEERCEDETARVPYARTATAVYRWNADAEKFVVSSDAVRRLQQQTAER